MPQATNELREEWGVADWKATTYLHKHGYSLNSHYQWIKPVGHTPTEKENRAILFLIQEWDYGGLAEET